MHIPLSGPACNVLREDFYKLSWREEVEVTLNQASMIYQTRNIVRDDSAGVRAEIASP